MPTLLIIEDEKVIRSALRRLLERNGYTVTEAGSIPEAEEHYTLENFDLIISDLRLPGPSGTELPGRYPGVPVLIMTSYASIKSAVEAIQQGAADYIAKPFNHDDFLMAVRHILDKHGEPAQASEARARRQSEHSIAGIIGRCPAMQRVFEHVRKIAPTDSMVLILGESGTGKELVARALHENSRRNDAPLIAVNCAAIPETLIESELFGHEKGAFTGAVGAREGLVEAANGGTLFLDEIGELPPTAQARLLRVLQEGEIRRVGSSRTMRVDVRLIAATHRDLQQQVQTGEFRSDLYYRLRVMEINLPPLRERGEDLLELANHMLDKACRRIRKGPLQFAPATLEAIRRYSWPGNVRELENAIERAVVLNDSDLVTPDLLAIDTGFTNAAASSFTTSEDKPNNLSLDDYFLHFVLSHQDTMSETELAKQLGISRKSLWERRQRLGIPKPTRRR